jgi:O-antigen/teichoic acid export membrane protein
MTTSPRHILRDFAWVGSGTAVSRGATLAALLLVVRTLPHETFAAYASGWAVYQIVSQLLSGLDLAYVDLTARNAGSPDLDAVYLQVKILGTSAVAVLGFAVLVPATKFGIAGPYAPAAVAGLAAGCVYGLFQTSVSRLQAHQRFRRFGRTVAVYNVGALIVTAALLAIGVDSAPLLIAAYAVAGAPWLLGLRHFANSPPSATTRARFLRHGKWLVASSLIYGLALRAELFIATVFLTAGALATYAAPARMFALVEFTMATMGAVLLPDAARLSSATELRGYVRRGVGVTVAFILASGVISGVRRPLAEAVLGSGYHAAGLVPVFCLAAVALSAYTSFKYLLFTARRPGQFAAVNLTLLVVKIVAGLTLIPWLGPVGAAWSVVAAYTTSTCVIAFLVRDLRPARHGRDVLVTASSAD